VYSMYTDYVIQGGGSGGSVDDFFNCGVGISRGMAQMGNFFWGGGIEQHNVTYRKNVALQCKCIVSAAE